MRWVKGGVGERTCVVEERERAGVVVAVVVQVVLAEGGVRSGVGVVG